MLRAICLLFMFSIVAPLAAQDKKKPDGNRLAYLDEVNPYYPHKDFAKLITPQWVGEEGVEAVVILAIDDMKDPKKYEAFLRPILNRLKKIDGRAPVSIMTCSVDPRDAQLRSWLKEGLSLECHTIDHPCPFFAKGFAKAKETYDKCVDLLSEVPNSKPVAFRMPCCDSKNTPSPRFYAEIFNKVTPKIPADANEKRENLPSPPAGEGKKTDKNSPAGGEGRVRGGNFLSIDSSVFNVFTSADPELPKELVLDDKGNERFKPYLPADRSFVNTIENYPYPYVIGRLCWQFPCMTPSDWQAQHRHKPSNPQTVADWKAALDCTVIKKGVFSMVFHPHGWIKNDQIVEFIDHAVAKHGKKVKFLTFKEALERLEKNVQNGQSLRGNEGRIAFTNISWINPAVHFVDLNNDGFMDVMIDSTEGRDGLTKVWNGEKRSWKSVRYSEEVGNLDYPRTFGILSQDSFPSVLNPAGYMNNFIPIPGRADFNGKSWLRTSFKKDIAVNWGDFRDLDGDGICELVSFDWVYKLDASKTVWKKLHFKPPVDLDSDSGHRFIDLDGDGKLDLIFSNEKEYGVYLFTDMEKGWSKKIMAGKRSEPGALATGELPMISRNGTDNGFWVHSGHLWWSNEDTATLKDHVDRRKISDLLKKVK